MATPVLAVEDGSRRFFVACTVRAVIPKVHCETGRSEQAALQPQGAMHGAGSYTTTRSGLSDASYFAKLQSPAASDARIRLGALLAPER